MAVTPGVEQRSGEESTATVELTHLIQAMATGTESALAAFYDQTSQRIYGLVVRLLQDAALAEEVTLDIYLQVWREAARYRVERGSPWAWLVTLARSRALDRLRTLTSERRYVIPVAPDEEDTRLSDSQPEEEVAQGQRARYVQNALAHLSPEQRQVVLLAYFEGLSHGAIAERLAVPLGTVKTRLRTGMIRLQALLSPWFGEEDHDP